MGKKKSKDLLKKKPEEEEEEEHCVFADLPQHLKIQILEKLPPQFLHKAFRLANNSCNGTVFSPQFIANNISQINSQLFVQVQRWTRRKPRFHVRLLKMDPKGLNYKLDYNYPKMGKIRSSCKGLVLMNVQTVDGVILSVKNFVTNNSLDLPRCPSDCAHTQCGVALGFDTARKQFKVVHMYADGFGFEIFTIGDPNTRWRRIPGPFKCVSERPYDIETFNWEDPVSINGEILHWYVCSCDYAISMNVSSEYTYKTYFPPGTICWKNYKLLEMGGCLAFVYKVSSTQIDVWIQKDSCDGESKIWVKSHCLNVESIIYLQSKGHYSLPDFMSLYPVASLRNGEVMVFMQRNGKIAASWLYFYDLQQMELRKSELNIKLQSSFVPHSSSLIQWTHPAELLLTSL